eukprot:gene12524-3213_t
MLGCGLLEKTIVLEKINHSICRQKDLQFKNEKVSSVVKFEVRTGETVVLDCEADGEIPLAIKWTKYGKPLQDVSYRMAGTKDTYLWILKLKWILLADAGNYSCLVKNNQTTITRTFMLSVSEKKETLKPRIADFSPRNLTVTVGSRVHLQCHVESQFIDTAPYIKLVKHLKIFKGNETNGTIFLNAKNSTVDREAYKKIDRFYEVTEKRDYFEVIETKKIERAFSSELVLNRVDLNDDATYTCITFNDVGYSKENMYLHVIPEPRPSIYELALAYAAKYGQPDTPPQLPLSVTVALPISLLVILTIGFIWWRENVKRKLDQEKISLINIKKLRELDNFSSLEHMDKFSSRLGTKPSSYISGDTHSRVALDHHDDLDDDDIDDREHDLLISNGHPFVHVLQPKSASPRVSEMIPLREMDNALSETPVTGRSSGLDSQSELEWEPVDLKLNISLSRTSELSQILDTSA